MGPDILKFHPARIDSLVRARAGPFQGQSDAGLTLNGHPSELNIAEEHHPIRSPVLHGVRKDIDVHERTPGLARSELAKLSIGMPQSERSLSCVRARPEKFKFEVCL